MLCPTSDGLHWEPQGSTWANPFAVCLERSVSCRNDLALQIPLEALQHQVPGSQVRQMSTPPPTVTFWFSNGREQYSLNQMLITFKLKAVIMWCNLRVACSGCLKGLWGNKIGCINSAVFRASQPWPYIRQEMGLNSNYWGLWEQKLVILGWRASVALPFRTGHPIVSNFLAGTACHCQFRRCI